MSARSNTRLGTVVPVLLVLVLAAVVALIATSGGDGGEPARTATTAHRPTLAQLAARTARLKQRKQALERRLRAAGGAAAPAGNPGGPLLGSDAAASFAKLESQLGGQAGLAVSGQGGGTQTSQRLGALSSGVAWSTIKVPLAIAAGRAGVGESATVSRAITESDNAAAEELWSRLGSGSRAAAAVQRVLAAAGDTGTTVNATRTRPPFTPFGQTVWTLDGQLRFVAALPCLGGADSVLSLMRQIVPGQRWGLGSAGVPAAFKGGWGPDPAGHYLVRQMGLLTFPGNRVLAVALIVQPDSGDFAAGTAALTRLARWVAAHADRAAVPAARC